MLSLNDILEDVVEDTSIVEPETFTLEDLEKTSEYLKNLDNLEEIVKVAWEAGRRSIEKNAGVVRNFKVKREASKALREAEAKLTAAEAKSAARKMVEKANNLNEGKGGGINPALLGVAGGAAVAGPLGYNLANENKKEELKAVAAKYYKAGRANAVR